VAVAVGRDDLRVLGRLGDLGNDGRPRVVVGKLVCRPCRRTRS
jgi:hypothetical protein